MKKLALILMVSLFTAPSALTQTISFDEAQKLYQSLSDDEMKEMAIQAMTQLLTGQKLPPKVARCASEQMVSNFTKNERREILLPKSYWKYLTQEKMNQNMIYAMPQIYDNCMKGHMK